MKREDRSRGARPMARTGSRRYLRKKNGYSSPCGNTRARPSPPDSESGGDIVATSQWRFPYAVLMLLIALSSTTICPLVSAEDERENENENDNNNNDNNNEDEDDDDLYSDKYLNVYGEALQSCSEDGTALAGYGTSGTGFCADDYGGVSRICVDLAGAYGNNGDDDGGGGGNNDYADASKFCAATGQEAYYNDENEFVCDDDMPCHEDDEQECGVENWCVSQWTFADLVGHGGDDGSSSNCGELKSYVACDSIHIEAVRDYESAVKRGNKDYIPALECLEMACGIDLTDPDLYDPNYMNTKEKFNSFFSKIFFVALVAVAGVAICHLRRPSSSGVEYVNDNVPDHYDDKVHDSDHESDRSPHSAYNLQ